MVRSANFSTPKFSKTLKCFSTPKFPKTSFGTPKFPETSFGTQRSETGIWFQYSKVSVLQSFSKQVKGFGTQGSKTDICTPKFLEISFGTPKFPETSFGTQGSETGIWFQYSKVSQNFDTVSVLKDLNWVYGFGFGTQGSELGFSTLKFSETSFSTLTIPEMEKGKQLLERNERKGMAPWTIQGKMDAWFQYSKTYQNFETFQYFKVLETDKKFQYLDSRNERIVFASGRNFEEWNFEDSGFPFKELQRSLLFVGIEPTGTMSKPLITYKFVV
ncbi:hypothetical protein C1646_766253 [Rhizophagus diaphanus]|nr:hypothetical protein C1646_766253 [Rhizophagus diaphanus] [Rhizophagus sp. MUCL 43196]